MNHREAAMVETKIMWVEEAKFCWEFFPPTNVRCRYTDRSTGTVIRLEKK